jgi:hypothetical protein
MSRRKNRVFASTPGFGLVSVLMLAIIPTFDHQDNHPAQTPRDLRDSDIKNGAEHYAAVACGLLQLACGGLDECHAHVTPLSWDSPTLFGGEPVPDSPARVDATYAHHLVHLREGPLPGEFGTGWNNSAYWASVLGSHPIFSQVSPPNAWVAKATHAAAGHAC